MEINNLCVTLVIYQESVYDAQSTKYTKISLIADRSTGSVISFAVPSEILVMHQQFLSIHIFETKVALELM
jgi:hypothetical protein